MIPTEFKEQNVVYGKDQPEYMPLPALKFDDGMVVTCWKLSWKELVKLIFTRKVWHSMLTFNKPLQPTLLTVNRKDLFIKDENQSC